jgi:uncharacterized protein (TIGR02996 family)
MLEWGLLAGVLDNPDEDGPRLVAADWLEEYGEATEHARAEFIRLQVRRAGLEQGTPEAEALERREKELFRRHGRNWDVELRSLVSRCEYRRGFVELISPYVSLDDVSPDLKDFLALAPRLWDLAPIRELNIWESGETLRRALSCDRLANLTELQLEAELDDAEDLRALAVSPYLRQLTRLGFAAVGDAATAIPGLFAAPWPRLRSLSFFCPDPTDAVAVLTRSPVASRLTTLRLEGETGTEKPGRSLAACSALGGLTELSLGLGDDGTAAALRSPHWRSLAHLHLSHARLGVQTAAALAQAPYLDSLVNLDLYYNELGVKGCRQLAKARPANLTTLNLGCNGLDEEAVEALAAGMRWPKLSDLSLSHNGLTDEALVALAGSPLLAPVSRLNLVMNHLGPAGARALAASPFPGGLRSLDLHSNRLKTAGVEALARSSAFPGLTDLDVGNNGVTDRGVRRLASSPILRGLRRLGVGGNHFGGEALRLLLEALAATGIESLDLQGCDFGDEGAAVLASAAPLAGLHFLDLGYNDLTDEGARHLLRCPWLAGVAHVKWGGNKFDDEKIVASMRERFPE